MQKEKAQQFHKLHHTGKLLVLPNIWDPLGAILLENLSYPAIATASTSIAFTNGYNDGEHIPFIDMLNAIGKIAGSVNLPVTADIESGYAGNDTQLEKNIKQLIEKGIAGINIEDTDNKSGTLYPVNIQCNRIRLIKKVAIQAMKKLALQLKDYNGSPAITENEITSDYLQSLIKTGKI